MEPEVALVALITARSSALLRTAYLLTGDRALAEDLLQESYLAVFRHRIGSAIWAPWRVTCGPRWCARTCRGAGVGRTGSFGVRGAGPRRETDGAERS